MKFIGEIIAAETTGDGIRITAQARAAGSADWRPTSRISIEVPDIDRNRKALYIGREFSLSLTPEKP